MASITGTSTLGTRNNDYSERKANEAEFKINNNENKDGKANAGEATGEKNENRAKKNV